MLHRIVFGLLLSLSCQLPLLAQPSKAEQDAIVAEGFALFLLEMAAWQSTDALLAQLPETGSDGYLSYLDGDSVRTIFYARADRATVVAETALDGQVNAASLRTRIARRPVSAHEKLLIHMRESLLEVCRTDTQDKFKQYERTGMNVLLLPGPQPVAYILTAPTQPGVMILGNDYRFEFDAAGNVTGSTALHPEMLVVNLETDATVSGHTHEKGASPYMTSTDICTLLLYGQGSAWTHHIVNSPKFVSSWNLEERALLIMTQKAWKRILDHQAKQK
jgi:hypothetical protein